MKDLFVEVGYAQAAKKGEELCGDSVGVEKDDRSTIIAWSDGLGSGVKANILATLTTRIIVSMLKRSASLEEVVATLAETLPVCKVRKIAYSTFSVIQIFKDGEAYLAEYDNPPVFWIRSGRIMHLEKRQRKIGNRTVTESNIMLQKNDWLVGLTDGVVHAGIGGVWNLGWRWEKIGSFLETAINDHIDAEFLSRKVIDTTLSLYKGVPGDDTTCLVAKVRNPYRVVVWAGPPEDGKRDEALVNKFIAFPGKKAACGGTTGNILARSLGKKIEVDLNSLREDIPPVGMIEGIDLVTEGILTLAGVLRLLKQGVTISDVTYKNDGISRLLSLLLESDEITFFAGRAINPAHQNPKLSGELSLKSRILEEVAEELRKRNKSVRMEYF
ncbi:MAG TPA: SpoIIE family protein phosphatase [Atribacteraceae bacterium]|nr:SpoIIE family protein phosphatase [Atribacteraceae bacterium]